MEKTVKVLLVVLLMVVTAIASYMLAYVSFVNEGIGGAVNEKVQAVQEVLDIYYVEEYDPDTLTKAASDAAAAAMVEATGDEWSYYISAEDMQAYYETLYNSYVGIGVTIQEETDGIRVIDVTRDGPAYNAGMMVGDLIIEVEGQSVVELGMSNTQALVRGEEGTVVTIGFLRDGERMDLTITRAKIVAVVATGELLEDNIGLITISNFDMHCADQTQACIEDLLAQGAEALIFDVRFNPGGMKDEMVELLDGLLPEGVVFRSVDYNGTEEIDRSDAECLEIPMVVLVNEDSYSAAEFFAAALQEYGVAQVVGTQTYGKGHFQIAINLSDGSAVNISAGKYYTPNGLSLAGVGITPDVVVELSDEEYADLYYGTLEQSDDDQLQAALELLSKKNS